MQTMLKARSARFNKPLLKVIVVVVATVFVQCHAVGSSCYGYILPFSPQPVQEPSKETCVLQLPG